MCRTIYNEDERYQNYPGGPPNRQRKIESDPVFKYHVHSCPRYPQRAPGLPADREYNAFLARADGSFEPLVIIPKRGQQFASTGMATPWEFQNSVLCDGGGRFGPVVNSWMEVTGHYASILKSQLIHPHGIKFRDISDYLAKEVPLYLWMYQVFDASRNKLEDARFSVPGWEPFTEYNGGISVLVLPNGKVIGAQGHPYTANNGTAISTWSPLDFWTPGSRLAAGAIRGLTNRVGAAVSEGFRLLSGPTKELAEFTVARMAGRTLSGMAASTGRVALPVEHLARRSLIMGEDLAQFRPWFAQSNPQSGFYDVFIHGDSTSFQILVQENGTRVWRNVSVKEVANTVKANLAPGDQIRLLACEVGTTGGPAQQLANELNHTVWAPDTTLPSAPLRTGRNTTSFVPDGGGKFHEFVPQRGGATLTGNAGKVTGNELQGEIRPGGRR